MPDIWKKKRLILDAGSGHYPWSEADVLCDFEIGPSFHRKGHPAKLDARPFVCCDLHKLPFKTNIFFYTRCNHVLEHVKSPNVVLDELKRVSHHGYANFPSIFSELFLGEPLAHTWAIGQNGSHKSLKLLNPWKKVMWRLFNRNWRIQLRDRILSRVKHIDERNIKW